MNQQKIKIKVVYNNEDFYKNKFLDYIIDFILKENERSYLEKQNGEQR